MAAVGSNTSRVNWNLTPQREEDAIAFFEKNGVPKWSEPAVVDCLRPLIEAVKHRRLTAAAKVGWGDWLAFCDNAPDRPDLRSYHDLLDEQYRR